MRLRIYGSSCPSVVVERGGVRSLLYDASAMAQQFDIWERVLVTPEVLRHFVPDRSVASDLDLSFAFVFFNFGQALGPQKREHHFSVSVQGIEKIALHALLEPDDFGERWVFEVDEAQRTEN